jgi:hypothetical protein
VTTTNGTFPTGTAYGVYIFQLRNSRLCGSYREFPDRVLLQTRKLLNQWFLVIKLKSYGISVSQMIKNLKIEIISLVIKFRLETLSLTSSMSSSKHKADPDVPMI